jgi:hypothetical protein
MPENRLHTGIDPDVEQAFDWLQAQGMRLKNGKWRYKDGKVLGGMGFVAILAVYRKDKIKKSG